MGFGDHSEQFRQDVEQIIRHLVEDEGSGAMIGPDGLTLGIPHWEEQTKDQRFSERAKTYGYPLGFAKTQLNVRDRLEEEQRSQVNAADSEARAAFAAAHEAVAWALDAERFLGSFNVGGRGGFPVGTVDSVANRMLVWLDHRGLAVVPQPGATSAETEEGEESVMASRGTGDGENPQAEEDEEPEEEESDEKDELVECPYCDGGGVVGGVGSSDLCPACAGKGTMAAADAEGFDPNDFEWMWSGIAHFKSDMDLNSIPASMFDHTQYDLRSEAGPDVDWSSLNLSGADLHDLDLSESILSGCNLAGCDLSHADLSGADLTDASLAGANLSYANLAGANLSDTDLEDAASLEGTLLRDVEGLSEEELGACLEAGAVLVGERQDDN